MNNCIYLGQWFPDFLLHALFHRRSECHQNVIPLSKIDWKDAFWVIWDFISTYGIWHQYNADISMQRDSYWNLNLQRDQISDGLSLPVCGLPVPTVKPRNPPYLDPLVRQCETVYSAVYTACSAYCIWWWWLYSLFVNLAAYFLLFK